MGGKVSVIMPAYNAAGCIEASVGSVLRQSYENLELLVIDDGSRDATPRILAELAEKDSRLRPITVENGGPAMARNHGLDAMDRSSEFVMFLDADDALLPDALACAVAGAAEGADLVLMGFTIVSADGSRRDYCEPEQSLTPDNLGGALADLYKANLLNQVWAKLYRAELLRENHIRFPDYRWGEDRLFLFDCLERVEKLRVLPDCKYEYIMQEGESLITRFYDKKFPVCLEIDRRVEALCERYHAPQPEVFTYMFAKSIFSCLTNLFAASCKLSRAEKQAFVKELIGNEQVLRRTEKPGGGVPVRLLCRVIHSGSVSLNLLTFRAVAAVGKLAPALFLKLKHRK